jgi:hypothetical protein
LIHKKVGWREGVHSWTIRSSGSGHICFGVASDQCPRVIPMKTDDTPFMYRFSCQGYSTNCGIYHQFPTRLWADDELVRLVLDFNFKIITLTNQHTKVTAELKIAADDPPMLHIYAILQIGGDHVTLVKLE